MGSEVGEFVPLKFSYFVSNSKCLGYERELKVGELVLTVFLVQAALVRELKSAGASKEKIGAEVKTLLELKERLGISPATSKASGSKASKSKKSKTAKK